MYLGENLSKGKANPMNGTIFGKGLKAKLSYWARLGQITGRGPRRASLFKLGESHLRTFGLQSLKNFLGPAKGLLVSRFVPAQTSLAADNGPSLKTGASPNSSRVSPVLQELLSAAYQPTTILPRWGLHTSP